MLVAGLPWPPPGGDALQLKALPPISYKLSLLVPPFSYHRKLIGSLVFPQQAENNLGGSFSHGGPARLEEGRRNIISEGVS